MTNISEHDTEQEWEGHTGEDSWVNFFVSGDAVCVDDYLEDLGEFILSEETGSLHVVVVNNGEGGLLDVLLSLLHLFHSILHVLIVCRGHPRESEVDSVLFFEFVQTGIEGLFFMEEDFKNFKKGHLIGFRLERGHNLGLLEVLSDSDSGLADHFLGVLDGVVQLSNLRLELVSVSTWWDVESLAHEGVAYLVELFSGVLAVLEDNDIDASQSVISLS
jgi:hypothetical protein